MSDLPPYSERTDDFSYKPIDDQNLEANVAYSPNRKPTTDELMARLMAKRVPEPTFDQDKADRLQRMGKINMAGKGISVLGDILATGLGAPVRRRQQDNIAPALYQSYQQNLDKYKAEKDHNIQRNYEQDRQGIIYGLTDSYRQQANKLAKQKQADWMKAKEMDDSLTRAKFEKEWDFKNRQLDATIQHYKNQDNANMVRANKTGSKTVNTEKPFMIAGVNGQDIPLTQREFRERLHEAKNNSKFTKTHRTKIEGEKRSKVPILLNSIDGEKNFVQDYLIWQNNQKDISDMKYYENKHRQGNTNQPPQQKNKTLPGITPKNTGFKFPGLGK